MNEVATILMAVAVMMQTFNLFIAGYLLKRVDTADLNLRTHERIKHI